MKIAILPCNGLDKPLGPLTRETALELVKLTGGDIVCPVLLNQAPDRYREILTSQSLTVVDGCATRCASKLAVRLELPVNQRIFIPEEMVKAAEKPENTLVPGPLGQEFARRTARAAAEALKESASPREAASLGAYPVPAEYLSITHDKFVFRVPAKGFHFNDNDCWVQVSGDRARVGVSDFVQQQMTDIAFFDPPTVGAVVEQFGELGVIESAKAVMEIVSPVSGRVVAVNPALKDKPEWINEDPYGQGWIAELELQDFTEDATLLRGAPEYAELIRRKAAEATAK